jgi:hypothetical protein
MHARTILRRRTVIAALACGTAGVIVAGSGLAATAASPGPSDTHSHPTLTLYQRQQGLLFVPGPGQKPGGPYGPGAQLVGNFELRSGGIHGPKVGQAVSECILDSSTPVLALCHTMNVVPVGQISTSEIVPTDGPKNITFPITGGTGKYRGATGQVNSTPLGDKEGRNSKLVFELGG